MRAKADPAKLEASASSSAGSPAQVFPLPHGSLCLSMIQLTFTACLVSIPFSYSCCVWRRDCDFSHTLAQLHSTASLLPKVFCPHTFQSCGNICSTDASLQETKPGERYVAFGAPQCLLKCCYSNLKHQDLNSKQFIIFVVQNQTLWSKYGCSNKPLDSFSSRSRIDQEHLNSRLI